MGAALLGLSVILGSCELRRDPGPGPLRASGARRGLLLQPRAPCLPHWPLRGGGGGGDMDEDDYSDGAAALAAPAPAGHGSAAQREAGGREEKVLRAYSEGRGGGGGGGGGRAVAREDLLDVGGRCASILAELGEPSRPALPLPFPS